MHIMHTLGIIIYMNNRVLYCSIICTLALLVTAIQSWVISWILPIPGSEFLTTVDGASHVYYTTHELVDREVVWEVIGRPLHAERTDEYVSWFEFDKTPLWRQYAWVVEVRRWPLSRGTMVMTRVPEVRERVPYPWMDEHPYGDRMARPRSKDWTMEVVSVVTGWPFPAMAADHLFDSHGANVLNNGCWYTLMRGIEAGPPEPMWLNGLRRALPTRVLWPGFVLNTVVHAVLLAVLIGVVKWLFRRVVRFVRGRRGVCVGCGYDASGLGACPECGAGGVRSEVV